MKLISEEAFEKAINEHIRTLIELWHETSTPEIKTRAGRAAAVLSEAALMAKALPAVDAVEVVRCRDCAKSEPCDVGVRWCVARKTRTWEDDFCSCGERRTEWK